LDRAFTFGRLWVTPNGGKRHFSTLLEQMAASSLCILAGASICFFLAGATMVGSWFAPVPSVGEVVIAVIFVPALNLAFVLG
jgi:hypothetical protein